MQATQSNIASGTWCRTEQFAALRYVSEHLERADLPPLELVQQAGTVDALARSLHSCADSNLASLACEAGDLLRAMRTCKELLADEGLSAAERECSTAQLESLKDKSLVLVDRYASRWRVESESARSVRENIKVLEQGAEWIAY